MIIFINQYAISSLFENNGKYFLWIAISTLIYWLGYLGVYHSGIFNERQLLRNNISKNSNQKKKRNLNNSKFEEIDSIIRNNIIYLNPDLSLDFLASKFNLSTGYLSQLFNEYTDSNFSNYINRLRVSEAKKLLMSKEHFKYTIVSIGLESGFNSKSTFYNAFKKITDMSPIEFRKLNMS